MVEGAGLKLDRSEIPVSLHDLIPLIEKWGFESLEEQDRFVIEMQAEQPSQVAEFNRRIDDAKETIILWGNTLVEFDRHKPEINERSWSHPYWSFLAALKIRELTEPFDAAAIESEKHRASTEARSHRYSLAIEQALGVFREKEYRKFVDLLEPFEDMLTVAQRMKLEFAKTPA